MGAAPGRRLDRSESWAVIQPVARSPSKAESVALSNRYEQARAPSTPVWDDNPRNVTFDREQGDREATDAAFATAAHVVEVTLANNRVTPVFLEPRSALASHDSECDTWTLTLGRQTAHGMRDHLATMCQ